jgi:hypothetical protein
MEGKVKKSVGILSALMCSFLLACPQSFAQSEVNSLVDVLVAKNILTRGEAVQILEDAKSAAQIQQVNAVEQGPSWLANTTFKGDLRLRLQYASKEGQPTATNNPDYRLRTRFRYGFTNTINDTLTIGAGLATGTNTDSGDPRSTNETWQDGFENWEFNIDEAYFDWHPYDYFTVIGGKRAVGSSMHLASDLLWDGDITLDGGTVKMQHSVSDRLKLFSYAGAYILDQQKAGDDNNENPWLYNIQPGLEYKIINEKYNVKFTGAFAYLSAQNIEGRTKLDAKGAGSNNTLISNKYVYSYNIWNPNFKLDYTWGGSKASDYVVGMFGDYVFNPDPEDTGFLLGAKAGHNKVGSKFGDWQVAYSYRYLENDASLDIFPDSDAYSGQTNVEGHEWVLQLGLAKNVILGFDYYMTEPVHGVRKTENLFQVDLLFKF